MRTLIIIFFSISISLASNAQVVFKTVVKQAPVITGESFQVQYVLEDIDRSDEFFPPDFKDFRFVSGPNMYEGKVYGPNGQKKLKNIVYTLEAIKTGRYLLRGASARAGDHFIKSDDAWIEVISPAEAVARGLRTGSPQLNSAFFLHPGEDPYEKMRKNIYLRVLVDKKFCYVGQPVTATFKLYSRLMSRSDIVKNPGFYGFTVQDMIGLNDNQSSFEIINGKKFDVHVVRKVQLYPLQAGQFTIDPMEVTNEVSFSRSRVDRKTEQEIVEGVFTEERTVPVNTEVYKNNMSTPPVTITVKPSPVKDRPADFTGATGRFLINASISKQEFAKNEEGELSITVSGQGNFTQLSPPIVHWPVGLEGFEPRLTDNLDHTHSPITGERTFRYEFVSVKPGHYTIPAINLSFFDPDSNRYKSISTKPVSVIINNIEKKETVMASGSGNKLRSPRHLFIWMGSFLVFIVAGILFLLYRKRNKKKLVIMPLVGQDKKLSVTEILYPASRILKADDKLFYTIFRQSIWNFFGQHFGLTGSKMNRQELAIMMNDRGIDKKTQETILEALQQCETGIFTQAEMEIDKEELFDRTKKAMEKIYGL